MTAGNKGAGFGETLFWPVERWRELQRQKLVEHLRHARRSGLYRDARWPAEKEWQTDRWETLLTELPLTTKDQLAAAGREAYAISEGATVAEWVCTSGTLGKPLDVPLTARDLDRLAENEAAALSLAGIGHGDCVILAVGMERMFVAGLAYWLGARRLGASCVRVGPRLMDHPAALGDLMQRLSTSARGGSTEIVTKNQKIFLVTVPSYAMKIDAPSGQNKLAGIVAIGEAVKLADAENEKQGAADAIGEENGRQFNALGQHLWEKFACPVMSTYAMTETCTTFAEEPDCFGGHLNPELAIVEVINEAGRPAARGEVGEIVVTPLGMEGMPLVRFATGDMAALHHEKCACGRTTPRVGPIVGRKRQLLKVRGVNVYPNAVTDALRAEPGVEDCVLVAQTGPDFGDALTVYLHAPALNVDDQRILAMRLGAMLRVLPDLRFVPLEELRQLQNSAGRKLSRFLDRRTQ